MNCVGLRTRNYHFNTQTAIMQGVVTTILVVLTSVTSGFDPVLLCILQNVGVHLRTL